MLVLQHHILPNILFISLFNAMKCSLQCLSVRFNNYHISSSLKNIWKYSVPLESLLKINKLLKFIKKACTHIFYWAKENKTTKTVL